MCSDAVGPAVKSDTMVTPDGAERRYDGVSLGITIIYMLMFRVGKAIGSSGAVDPLWAAWTPNVVFLVAGLVLMARLTTPLFTTCIQSSNFLSRYQRLSVKLNGGDESSLQLTMGHNLQFSSGSRLMA